MSCRCDPDDVWATPDGWFASPTQVFRWDNIGFDGPAYPLLRGYDVADALVDASWEADQMLLHALQISYAKIDTRIANVDLTDAQRATINLSAAASPGVTLRYQVNGRGWHSFKVPTDVGLDEGGHLRAFTLDVPLAELVSGTNRLQVEGDTEGLGNVDLTIHPSR